MPTSCPKCLRENADGATTCTGCGLIFANYDPEAATRLRAERAAHHAAAARSRNALMLAGGLLLAGLAGVAWWTNRPDPYAVAAPTDAARSRFSGQALDYAGSGAELRLVDINGGERAIGRIEAGGRFRFELPSDLAPLAPPSWLTGSPPGDPTTWNARQREFDRLRKTPEYQASVDLYGLGAGEGWRTIASEPSGLVAARYGVIYVGPGDERGDLIASNSDHRGMAMPGDHMLVFVHANRAGRVDGEALRLSTFGAEVANPWKLDLQPGWNVVLSRQLADLNTLEYVTTDTPRDLQWRTLDPRTLR
jgi:hypothetical protein